MIESAKSPYRKALTERLLAEQEKTKVQKKMVKESLTKAFEELHSGKVHHDARTVLSKK